MENTNINTNTTGTETTTVTDTNTEQPKTYTQEEVDKLLQQESDRRVTEALKKANKKNQEKLREAEKLSKMNDQEKYEYELEQREKAIADKEHELALAENKAIAMSILSEKGISTTLVDFVVADDADTMKANIDLLARAFQVSVRAEVEKRLASTNTSPKRQRVESTDPTINREKFKKMTIQEQMRIYDTNPDLYAVLTQKND